MEEKVKKDWKPHDEYPRLYQKVIGRIKNKHEQHYVYFCGEYIGPRTDSIMVKTWHMVENATGDHLHRDIVSVDEWKPLKE